LTYPSHTPHHNYVSEPEKDIPSQQLVRVSDFNDPSNPRSMVNITTDEFAMALNTSSIKLLLSKDEYNLCKVVQPTPTLNRLRMSFWDEYDRAQEDNDKMVQENIWRGVCSEDQFFKITMKPKSKAWMLYPVVDYDLAINEALTYGLGKIREIFEFPLYKIEVSKAGKDKYETRKVPDVKVADLMLKTVNMLSDRAKGAVVKKIETKTTGTNLHVHADVPAEIKDQAADVLAEEIRRLEGSIIPNTPTIIEAEVIDGESRRENESSSS